MILASCSLNEAEQNDGTLLVGKEKVLLNIEVSMSDLLRAFNVLLRNKNVKCITITDWCLGKVNLPSEVPEGKAVFARSDYPNVCDVGSSVVKPLVVLHNEFYNMKELVDLQKGYPNIEVHFLGGKLLEIPGIHIGRFDTGKEKMSAYFNGVYDCFLEMRLSEIDDIEVVRSKLNKRSLNDLLDISDSYEPKQKKEKKVQSSKLKGSFSNLFGGDSVDF